MTNMFRVLEDGAWHSLKEIAEEIGVPVEELARHCETISKNKVVEYDAGSCRVRLEPHVMSMILKLRAEEEAEADWRRRGAGTIIIPQGKGLQIQGVTIHNKTEQDLNVELTFNRKLDEIVISNA
jgi:hypothetical protein